MPHISRKQRYLAGFRSILEIRRLQRSIMERDETLVDDSDVFFNDVVDASLKALYRNAESQRYLFRRNNYRKGEGFDNFKKVLELDVMDEDFDHNEIHNLYDGNHNNDNLHDANHNKQSAWLSGDEFLRKYRMTRCSFKKVLLLIKDHEVFHNTSKFKQAPVEFQLMTFLKFVGTEGTGGSNSNQRETFRIGYGTAALYRHRVTVALCALAKDFYNWPDVAEREEISKEIFQEYDFPHCVGIADGTLFPLALEPATKDAPDYHGRKFPYSLSTLVVCDHKRRIRYFLAGFPGSAHDNRIYKASSLYKNPASHFSASQYILGDSAFANNPHMVSSYKKPQRQTIPERHEKFNTKLSELRIISEHTIGLLKGRFPWLRSIRLRIQRDRNGDSTSSVSKILVHILATVVLHNILISFGETKNLEEWNDDADNASAIDDPRRSPDEDETPNDHLIGSVLDVPHPVDVNEDDDVSDLCDTEIDSSDDSDVTLEDNEEEDELEHAEVEEDLESFGGNNDYDLVHRERDPYAVGDPLNGALPEYARNDERRTRLMEYFEDSVYL